jgi:nitrous oxidase accessory protein
MWCDRSVYNDNTASGNMVGLALMFSKRITANGNTLYNNTTHGILLTQVTRSEVAKNVIIGNSKGIFVYNSLYNKIQDNFVARNNLGLHYWGGSEENEIRDNAFVGNEVQVKFVAAHDQTWDGNFWSDYVGWDSDGDGRGDTSYRSNTLVDALLWKYPIAKMLLASPALQVLALAEREFPVITVPKGVDRSPRMDPTTRDWGSLLERYPRMPAQYYGAIDKLPHVPAD